MADTILVVDDSPFETAVLSKLLCEYTVSSAGCGEEMWTVLAKETPSIILLDVVLPGEDCFQIAEQLSSIEK